MSWSQSFLLVILASSLFQSSQVSADTSAPSSVNRAEDKVGDSLDEVAGMIRNTLSAYESKVITFPFMFDVRTV